MEFMRQQRKPGTRKERQHEQGQAGRNVKTFVGGCSQCGDKQVKVARFRGGQLCVGKCLSAAISRLGGATQMPADQVIKAD
jgi:hypothetical protein